MHPEVMVYGMCKVYKKNLQEGTRQKVDAAVNNQQRSLSPKHEGGVQIHMDKRTYSSRLPGVEKPRPPLEGKTSDTLSTHTSALYL
jgi:hypothetical protein